jgi:CelD/BcsL family acetyltransferase involved in cellulose biosynthesis
MSDDVAHWHSYDYELMYRLGDLTLGKRRLPVMRKVFKLPELARCDGAIGTVALPPLTAPHCGYLLSDIPQGVDVAGADAEALMTYQLKAYRRCFIDMRGSFDDYQAKFSAKTRSGIKRKLRKFAEHGGGMTFRRYTRADEIDAFFEAARPVSAQSYQERLLDCGLPSDPAFVAQATHRAAQDALRAFVLFSGDQPVSYLYCPVDDGVLEYAFLGYRADVAKLSAGTVLQWLALESLYAERRFSAFDFTEGESEHKLLFSTSQVPCRVELLLRRSPGVRMSVASHRAVDRASRIAGNLLDDLGLKSRVKTWLRRTA